MASPDYQSEGGGSWDVLFQGKKFRVARKTLPLPEYALVKTASDRKTIQLCGQVNDALTGILAGLGDERLNGLMVVSVTPAPHAGRLHVTVAAASPADVADLTAIREQLDRANGRIRSEVAHSITRRKAPELAFDVVAAVISE